MCEASHEAHIAPWIALAEATKAKIKWWKIEREGEGEGEGEGEEDVGRERRGGGESGRAFTRVSSLLPLLSERTRVLALPHSSNVLGKIVDVAQAAAAAKVGDCGGAS